MAKWVRESLFLPEDLDRVPSTHIIGLTTTCNSNCGGSQDTLASTSTCIQQYTKAPAGPHANIHLQPNIFSKKLTVEVISQRKQPTWKNAGSLLTQYPRAVGEMGTTKGRTATALHSVLTLRRLHSSYFSLAISPMVPTNLLTLLQSPST